ncbi:hypothetical protein NG796_21905 [Laspinema sp. A4]|uniref:histidine kinase dimerization/phospho-acceptor domain-containing protein n=1 Tax=Laspinema sp. D2d TaxID=2953686 RepID=UPI0021BB158F|nr:histidine kinase dimerization/phospho-acceptor domain-containing protein [Laspinema sp. D2d]MCT7985936.1 hypothetical protein [Laspinema sp. D2d]
MHTIQSGTTQEHQEKLVALKSYFMTLISHELRTPLTTILLSADLLECYSNSWSDEKKLKHVQQIQTAALEITKLIESEHFTETLQKVASEIH